MTEREVAIRAIEDWRPWCVGHADCSLCDDCCDGDADVDLYLGPEPSARP